MVKRSTGTPRKPIKLRGVRVHNLKNVDLDLPRGQLSVFCGVSGSGKTSLALDTLYAEGQRRYIESFSAYTRQYLQRLDRPEADSIDDIPPAVAVTRSAPSRSNRSTVATATEIADYLRLLFAKIAALNCYRCGAPVRTMDAQSSAVLLSQLPRARLMIGFPAKLEGAGEGIAQLGQFQAQGFLRIVLHGRIFHLAGEDRATLVAELREGADAIVIVDRLTTTDSVERLTESLETSQQEGEGTAVVLVESEAVTSSSADTSVPGPSTETFVVWKPLKIDDRVWQEGIFSKQRRCHHCQIEFDAPQPRLFSFNHPLGACPTCEGFGDVMDLDERLIVPDPSKTLREGAIAPWNSPSYKHELEELLALADDYDLPVDIPYRKLNAKQKGIIQEGVPERSFGGLKGFFAWLERKKYKMHVRVFLSRWRSYRRCPTCDGKRLKPEALAYHLQQKSFAEICRMQVNELLAFFQSITFEERERRISEDLLEQVQARLGYLTTVGLDYLTLDRTLRTLSGGEAQRVALTTALGSNLVNMLYVLDEPTAGLHPADVDRMVEAVAGLRNRGNTVVVVEHDEQLMRSADHLVELGPAAGANGGEIIFQGPLADIQRSRGSLTGDYLSGRRKTRLRERPRRTPRGWLELTGARGHNLQNLSVQFPLACLCLVTGVSGSGKSTLVQETLYGAILKRKRQEQVATAPFEDLVGTGQIEEVMLIDQGAMARSGRSNPVTYAKAFDAIRTVFAETIAARTHNYTAGHFSFNSPAVAAKHAKGMVAYRLTCSFSLTCI